MNMLMNARALTTAALLASSLLWSVTAAAVEPEKQRIFVSIDSNGACGTANNPCEVPVGQRLIIEHVSGFVLIRNTADTNTGVSLLVTDPQLGLIGNAFHVFVATKTATTPIPVRGRGDCLCLLHAIQNDVESGSDFPILTGERSGCVRIPREAVSKAGEARLTPRRDRRYGRGPLAMLLLMEAHEVSTLVNSPENDSAECIQPVSRGQPVKSQLPLL
jgi:hypothetical protein